MARTHHTPSHSTPSHSTPSHNTPSHTTPTHQTPTHQTPTTQTPTTHNPTYPGQQTQPSQTQPGHTQPGQTGNQRGDTGDDTGNRPNRTDDEGTTRPSSEEGEGGEEPRRSSSDSDESGSEEGGSGERSSGEGGEGESGSGESSEGEGGDAGEDEGGEEEGGGEGGDEGGEFEPTTPSGQLSDGSEISDVLEPPEPSNGDDVKQLVEDAGIEVMAVDWVFQHIAGQSLVDMVIKPITGDFSKMRQNGDAWETIGDAMKQFSATMSGNADIITQDDWHGPSALAHKAYVDIGWKAGLAVEGQVAKLIAKGFFAVADGSEKLAAEALKLLKKLIDKLIEIAAKACIPVAGWAAEATTIIDALDIANQIFSIIEMIKDIVEKVQSMWQSIQDIGSQLAKIKDIQSIGDVVDIGKNIKGDVSDISSDAKDVAGDARDIGSTAKDIGKTASGSGEEGGEAESSPSRSRSQTSAPAST
ncbi:hypothetical protein FPZ12_019140 [Amycolatopsis acidicola]|uniref:WXG100 family type VII secretion target n=1 Tax=Amycolatopsis acidicola TaxID=2596893 RepID=A0A5N0V1W6_9PSEU|nr:hypothetical protein [Amycolatopsis acidicola]KAA9160005.1 hypothetical protein FPZ12_019140 [Amycolatopsis acidicola]